ncbi:MAG: hypothetical protein H0X12_15610 [Nocardioides sp.]|nr:hypothetical protein [Nocardioides sp.]
MLLPGLPAKPGRCDADIASIEGYDVWGDRMTYSWNACRRLDVWAGPGRGVHEVRGFLAPGLERALGKLPLGPAKSVR